MNESPANPVISYATQAAKPTQRSNYAVASLIVSAGCIIWLMLDMLNAPLPFDFYKRNNIGSTGSVFGVILCIASYAQRHRKRGLKHFALVISVIAFLLYILLVPL